MTLKFTDILTTAGLLVENSNARS